LAQECLPVSLSRTDSEPSLLGPANPRISATYEETFSTSAFKALPTEASNSLE